MSRVRALVTGATGLVGRALSSELARRGIDHVGVALDATADVRAVDLTDTAALHAVVREVQPTHVFHLAGAFRADGYAALFRINCGVAATLLDATAPDARLVLVGSAAEYGPVEPSEGPVDETRACRPTSAYGASKLAQTELALAAARSGRRVVVVRPSNVIGPGVSPLLSIGNFARQARAIRDAGAEPVLRTGDLAAVRDFVDGRDVARAMVDLADHDAAFGSVFNVSRGSGHSLREALDELLGAFAIDARVVPDPSLGAHVGAASYFVASHARLAQYVAFRPHSLRESMIAIAAAP